MPLVVLPDIPLPPDLLNTITAQVGPTLVDHPSGSPWILGSAGGRKIVHARNREIDVVIVGNDATGVDHEELARLIRGKHSVGEIDAEAARLADGDTILFAREAGRMRSQAPAFLTRSLCWTTLHGVPVIADEQVTLRQIGRLGLNPAVLASRLTDLELSYPFGLLSIWDGVQSVGPGQWWDSRGGAAPMPVTWWTAPRPDQGVADLAGRLREDLFAALHRTTGQHAEISADLSGGIDSTTLAFFLAAMGRTPRTLFLRSADVANNDHRWAGRAAAELGADHTAVAYGSLFPLLLESGTGQLADVPEGPSAGSLSSAAIGLIEEALAGRGTTLHLNGHAGDALFGTVSTMLWSLVHSREPHRFRTAWRYQVVNKFPFGRTLRAVLDRSSYQDDLRRIAGDDFTHPDDEITAQARWAPLPKVHPAVTPAAREHLHALAAAAVTRGTRPLSTDRTTHEVLQYLIVHGNDVRRMNQSGSGRIRFDSPYLNRQVVETSLAQSIGARTRQYPAKPLLAAARPPTMSLDYFTRTDKGDYTAEVFAQHQALAPLLKDLFADGSALEDLGLISAARVMRSITEFSADGSAYAGLDYLGFAERWLRSVR